jgi:hypothetical protein
MRQVAVMLDAVVVSVDYRLVRAYATAITAQPKANICIS